jgi:hypothetical protein
MSEHAMPDQGWLHSMERKRTCAHAAPSIGVGSEELTQELPENVERLF